MNSFSNLKILFLILIFLFIVRIDIAEAQTCSGSCKSSCSYNEYEDYPSGTIACESTWGADRKICCVPKGPKLGDSCGIGGTCQDNKEGCRDMPGDCASGLKCCAPDNTSQNASPTNKPNACTQGGGSCIANTVACSGVSLNLDCENSNQTCCKNSTAKPNACTQGGGSCIANTVTCNSTYLSLDCEDNNQTCCKSSTATANSATTGSGQGIVIPTNTGLPDPPGGVLTVLRNLITWLMFVFLFLTVGAFIITGIKFLLSVGGAYSAAAQSAKKDFENAVIAVVVVSASLIIILTINTLLNASPSGATGNTGSGSSWNIGAGFKFKF